MMQNDPSYELHVDEDDNKFSARRQTEPDLAQNEVNYTVDPKLQRLYESNQGPLPNVRNGLENKVRTDARNSRQSLPKVMGSLTHSIQ